MARRWLVDGRVDLVTFELLEHVAQSGTMTAAAAAVGVSQQAASARIDRAERLLGVRLLHRGVTGSTLTEQGGMVLEWAVPVLEAARRAEVSLEALRDRDAAITVTASQTVAEFLLPDWLQALRQSGVASPIRLRSGNSADVLDQVRSGVAGLGFLERPDVPADLHSTPVGRDVLTVVVAPTHPWAGALVTPADLAAMPLLLRERGSGTRATLETWAAQQGLSLTDPAAELGTASAIRAAARAGVAPAVLSERAVEEDVAAGALTVVRIAGGPIRRAFTAVWSAPVLVGTARALVEAAVARETARAAAGSL